MEGGSQKKGQGASNRDQAACSDPVTSQLRMVLVGRTGCGKSATGNSILGRQAFEFRLAAQPVTRRCQKETGSWDGRSILVVDTPPIFEAQARTQDMAEDVRHCYKLSAPGPHVLLVTQLGYVTEQDAQAVRKVKEIFGEKALRKHGILVFTRKEDLDGGSLEDYVKNTDNMNLETLLRNCNGRCCGFNNRATQEEQREQLVELMVMVEQLERKCKGAFLPPKKVSLGKR